MANYAASPLPNDPIAALIVAGSHRDAIARCAREHGPSIGRLCMAMLGNQSEAEEASQETLIAAHAAMPAYRADGSVRAWLFGIARRLCARRIETRARRERRLRLVHDADAESGLPDHEVDVRRRARRLRDALDALKPSERDAVLLRYQAELEYFEIAQACGIDVGAARKRASRALARLREELKGEV